MSIWDRGELPSLCSNLETVGISKLWLSLLRSSVVSITVARAVKWWKLDKSVDRDSTFYKNKCLAFFSFSLKGSRCYHLVWLPSLCMYILHFKQQIHLLVFISYVDVAILV